MDTSHKITIAIDGHSSCGKSTMAKALAKKLNYIFIDSGAMYRGVALFAIENGLAEEKRLNIAGLVSKLDTIELRFELNKNGEPELFMNGRNVERQIRTAQVSAIVSHVAKIKEVRSKLVAMQRMMGQNGGIVMDGRDIGSVVFPDAELKLFVTADIETRTNRRFRELREKGIQIERNEVRQNLLERDRIDSTRKESPLIRTEDAILLDNSNLSREEQVEKAYAFVQNILNKHN